MAPAGAADARVEIGRRRVQRRRPRLRATSSDFPCLSGRDFSDAELAPGSSERVAIIDDALAQRLWPGEDALGRLIQFLDDGGTRSRPAAASGRHRPGGEALARQSPAVSPCVRAAGTALRERHDAAASDRRRRTPNGPCWQPSPASIREVDERVPVLRVETWRDHLDGSLDVWLYRAGARVFSAFGGIALLLAVIGVYGVKSYVVSRRTREFGIRIATGAHPRALLWQVLREGGRITAIGIGIGLLLALGAGQLLQGILYGVDARRTGGAGRRRR